MSLEVLDRHSKALFEFLWCPVCGHEVFSHIPFEGVFCKNCNTQVELQESHEDRGYEEAVLACFDTDTTWNLHVDEKHRRDLPDGSARVKILGANNTVTAVTSAGEAVVCNARSEFERFRSLSERISTLQSKLPEDEYSSRRIRRTYARRGNRRDHHLEATVRLVAEWLHDAGVEHVVVGDLTNVLSTHWNARVNEKTHAFWSHGTLTERIRDTFEEVGLEWSAESEAGSSSTCPSCGSEHVEREGDAFDCLECGFRGHSDVVGAANLLVEHSDISIEDFGLMAQPAGHDPEREWRGDIHVTHLKWDDHAWTPTRTGEREHDGRSTNEASANPQVHSAR